MDLSLNTNKLTRYDTNDSTSEDSLFSRKTSSSSLMSPSLWKSSTKLNQLCDLNERKLKVGNSKQQVQNNNASSYNNKEWLENDISAINIDALRIALTKIKSNNEESILQAQQDPYNNVLTTTPQEEIAYSKWCLILVGLPASGKSSIVNHLILKIKKELPNLRADTFNAGNFRRNLTTLHQSANFFDFNNKEAKKQRDLFASLALDHLLNSLANDSLDIGIFDATNSTIERREKIIRSIEEKEISSKGKVKIHKVILHVQIDDEKLLNYNIEGKTKNQDYNDQEHDVARGDFIKRLNMYRSAFEDISKEELDHYNCMYIGITNAKVVELYEPSHKEEEEEDLLSDDVTIRGFDEQPHTPDHHEEPQQQYNQNHQNPLFDHQDHNVQDKIDHNDEIYVELVNFAKSYYRDFGKAYNDCVNHWHQSKLVHLRDS